MTAPLQTEQLDPLTLRLRGSRLIEASAGTGKTWTLAALYLRLVLGHGDCVTPHGQPLHPAQILVMTFTRAAARELGDRIRARLVEAARCFRGEATPHDKDSLLPALLADYPEGPARQQAAWRLAQAAEAMDDAALFTIDAWCQRALREHALLTGSRAEEQLEPDESGWREQAVRDTWRQEMLPLSGAPLSALLTQWPTVESLSKALSAALRRPVPSTWGEGSLVDALAHGQAEHATALAALKAPWAARVDEMVLWIEAQAAHLPPKKFSSAPKWLDALRAWAHDPTLEEPQLTDTAWARFTPAEMTSLWIGEGIPDLPPAFAAFAELPAALEALPSPHTHTLAHATVRVQQRIQTLKAQQGCVGFADLLQRLDEALDERLHPTQAAALRQRLIEQYPVALIDEFQDTAPAQWRVFDRLYRVATDDPERALLMIGDPKQAIYAFRGADIRCYLQARSATAGRHEWLGTNHRSTRELVHTVNALFLAAEARDPEGAFAYGNPDQPNPVPFLPVEAAGRAERLMRGGQPIAPLHVGWLNDALGREACLPRLADWGAEQIAQRLMDPSCAFVHPEHGTRALRPGDVAVLVRDQKEAQAIREALRRRGLNSVYLSDRDNVLASDEATDLLRLLEAVHRPRDLRLARAALATRLLQRSLDELRTWAEDDSALDRACAPLDDLHTAWQRHGVMAMLRQALHRYDLPARWLAEDDGERRLTNVLHLGEWLQQRADSTDSPAALLHAYAQAVHEAQTTGATPPDEQVLRLESDADCIQVVTIHKSKGLEYPVVVLPFAARLREADAAPPFPAEWGGTPRLHATAGDHAAAAQATRQEDLRLLYVALTRPRHHLILGLHVPLIGQNKALRWHDSAIGRLLSGPTPLDSVEDARAALETWVQASQASFETVPAEPAAPTRWVDRSLRPALREAPIYRASFDRQWGIASYSSVVKDSQPLHTLREDPQDDTAPQPVSPPATQPAAAWHRFPRGALPGNLLHDQLEWLAGERFALPAADAGGLQDALARRLERVGWTAHTPTLQPWLHAVCHTPLPALETPLSGLAHTLAEMEFWFPLDDWPTADLDALCREHLFAGEPRPALTPRTLRGLMMGFADLVYAHAGRHGVLDYKSNALGDDDSAYTQPALVAAALSHRYEVQAVLYLLALHRLLRSRLQSAYRPEAHLHGAQVFFLRGVQAPGAGVLFIPAPLELLHALDARLPAPTFASEMSA
ncbi:exodeoxyribonuclease V subunit beta [Inhella gelatinilytica]|uniref:RecBCD enzyme subunit RecB n=1 Tax=Inhella gelatinilytica TaxID=2795030 RepID=A0A931J025_9BURK|nr:exodeoxyribonuclease V subunit beta [Inhella gelatinilytica]MBH9554294.1 exodeoxyribonuclease V subunit beta [Inhella gelatinilytica]